VLIGPDELAVRAEHHDAFGRYGARWGRSGAWRLTIGQEAGAALPPPPHRDTSGGRKVGSGSTSTDGRSSPTTRAVPKAASSGTANGAAGTAALPLRPGLDVLVVDGCVRLTWRDGDIGSSHRQIHRAGHYEGSSTPCLPGDRAGGSALASSADESVAGASASASARATYRSSTVGAALSVSRGRAGGSCNARGSGLGAGGSPRDVLPAPSPSCFLWSYRRILPLLCLARRQRYSMRYALTAVSWNMAARSVGE
jgi:hypothetical protein